MSSQIAPVIVAAGDIKEAEDGTTFYEERRDPYVLDFSRVIQ